MGLVLQGPVRGQPALDSADGVGVEVSENDSKLDVALESQRDEATREHYDCVQGHMA